MRCEDYPCCGHVGEDGPCPDFDPDTGKQLNMRCVCGAAVPLSSRSSLCAGCLRRGMAEDGYDDFYDGDVETDEDEDEDEDDGERDYGTPDERLYGYDYE
jgi:hypothetical protein